MESRLAVADLQKAADTLVIALACAGDDSAFAEVLRRRQGRVRRFMYHLCRQPALGDELATLPPVMRLCVVLAYNEGLSHPEIVTLTGLPLGTVKSHITRGASRLREILADYGEEA